MPVHRTALVPVERLEQMLRTARHGLREVIERQKQGPGADLSDEQAMELGLLAQRSARKARPKNAGKRKRARK